MLTLRVSMAPAPIAWAGLFGGREAESAHRLVGFASLNRERRHFRHIPSIRVNRRRSPLSKLGHFPFQPMKKPAGAGLGAGSGRVS